MVVRGPASANYDIDLGAYTIADWYYDGADEIAARVANPSTPGVAGAPGSPPPSDNVLFNGTNVAAQGGGGRHARTELQKGKVHLLRLVNPSVENSYSVSLTGHSLTIVAADYVPVAPRSVSSVFVGVGQRYDVLIRADQAPGDYFLNVTFSRSTQCGSSRNPSPAAVFSYVAGRPDSQEAAAGASPVPIALPKPKRTPPPATPHAEVVDARCTDLRDLAPIVQRKVPLERFEPGKQRQSSLNLELEVDDKAARVFWTVNKSAINVSWSEPTLSRGGFGRLGRSANVVKIPTADSVRGLCFFLCTSSALLTC